MMLHYLETDQYTSFPRQHLLQPSASTTECARLLQKPPHYCLCCRQSLELSPTQDIMNIVKLALTPDNHTTTAVAALEAQLFNLSTRCSNSK